MEQPPGSQLPTLPDANIYPENRVITYATETNQPVYSAQNNAEVVANRQLVSPHIIQDGASNFVEGKEVARKTETDATYQDTREAVVAPQESNRQIAQTPDPATGVQPPEATEMLVNPHPTTSGYGDRIAVAVPIVSPHATAAIKYRRPGCVGTRCKHEA